VVEKKRRWENKKRFSRLCVALATGEQRGEMRRVEGRKFFFASEQNSTKNAKNEKKQKEGNNQKKFPKKDSESPHNKFLASTTMADVQHERGYQKQVGVNVG
jgi:hypothetical protein